jgi:hypothetical protein
MATSRRVSRPRAWAERLLIILWYTLLCDRIIVVLSGVQTEHTVLTSIDQSYAPAEAAVGVPRLIATISLGSLALSSLLC